MNHHPFRRSVAAVLIALTGVAGPLAGEASAHRASDRGDRDEVTVCQPRSSGWRATTVKERKVDKLLGRGAGLPGQPVPGQPGFQFDDNCVPVQSLLVLPFEGASQTVGDECTNCANVFATFTLPDGTALRANVGLRGFDTEPWSWSANTAANIGGLACRYPIVQVRASASLGDQIERIDVDFSPGIERPVGDLAVTWSFAAGDRPTLAVESITIDPSSPRCQST